MTHRSSHKLACLAGIASFGLLLAIEARASVVPKPRPKPSQSAGAALAAVPLPRPNPRRRMAAPPAQQTDAASGAWPAAERSAAVASCRETLTGLDVVYAQLPAIGKSGGCGTAAPVELSSVAGVTLKPPAIVNCEVARALHDWIQTSVQPAAKRRLKTQVTEVHVAASYVCRLRNNARSGKLSEHGRANAIDMSGFSFARSDAVAVGGGWGSGLLASVGLSRSGSFLGDIRRDACSFFTTVLGPGSDSYHGDHFHVDVLQRRGDYRICK